jgi:hypothetical protein
MLIQVINPRYERYALMKEKNEQHIYPVLRAIEGLSRDDWYLVFVGEGHGNANPDYGIEETIYKSPTHDALDRSWIRNNCSWFRSSFVRRVEFIDNESSLPYLKSVMEYGG